MVEDPSTTLGTNDPVAAKCREPMFETGYAKINLALHVRRRRADGYHELETLFAFADTGDELSAVASDTLSLSITGPFAHGLTAGPDNLVLRAARALQDHYGVSTGAAVTLDKHLPIASGIGGGSADAAAALRLLVRLWRLPEDQEALRKIGAQLGADVPACIASETCMGFGTGTELVPINLPDVEGTPLLLVNPLMPCPTGPVFAAWDGVDRGELVPEQWATARNDLQDPALSLVPVIGELLDKLASLDGAKLVRLSGSGATCFALFDDAASRDEAKRLVNVEQPAWWVLSSNLKS